MAKERLVITDAGRDVPENIKLVQAESACIAYRAAEKLLRVPPANAVVWTKPANWASEELSSFVSKILTGGWGGERRFSSPLTSDPYEMKAYIADYFSRLAQRKEGRKNPELLKAFQNQFERLILPIFSHWPDMRVSLSIREDKALSEHVIHIDEEALYNSGASSSKDKPFFGQAVRMVIALSEPGTALFDHKDMDVKGKETKLDGIRGHFMNAATVEGNPKPVHASQWSVTFLTGKYWPHPPIAHSLPQKDRIILPQRRAVAIVHMRPR